MPTPAFPEYLTIDGSVILGTRASWASNLYVLRNSVHRGENRLIPDLAGRRAYRRRVDEIAHILELVIAADFDSDGAPTANLVDGQEANIAELEAIADPVDSTTGTREVVWHKRNGDEVVADCQVGPLTIGEEYDDAVLATLDIVVPDGGFVPVTP